MRAWPCFICLEGGASHRNAGLCRRTEHREKELLEWLDSRKLQVVKSPPRYVRLAPIGRKFGPAAYARKMELLERKNP